MPMFHCVCNTYYAAKTHVLLLLEQNCCVKLKGYSELNDIYHLRECTNVWIQTCLWSKKYEELILHLLNMTRMEKERHII